MGSIFHETSQKVHVGYTEICNGGILSANGMEGREEREDSNQKIQVQIPL